MPPARRLAAFLYPSLLVSVSALPLAAAAPADVEAILRQNCFACHGGGATMGGVNLEELIARGSLGEQFQHWERVAGVIAEQRMPPKGLPGPDAAAREKVVGWVRAELAEYAERHKGDPGRVTVRRLTSGEYRYTIQDLTGQDLNLGPDPSADSVGGEGFTNYGDVQFMQDAGLERYLESARRVADHAVIGAGPLIFSGDPGMMGMELSAIRRLHEIYERYGFRAASAEGGMPYGLEHYGKSFYVAWRDAHRTALGETRSLDELARAEGLNPRFVRYLQTQIAVSGAAYPVAEVIARWRALPAPAGRLDEAAEARIRKECEKIEDFVVNWPRWLYGAGELAKGGAGDERTFVISDAALPAKTTEKIRFIQRVRDRGKATMFFSVMPTDPGMTDKPLVVWRDAKARSGRDTPPVPLREMLDAATAAKLGFGGTFEGVELGPDDFALRAGTELAIEIALPDGAMGFSMEAGVELQVDRAGDTVLRLVVADNEKLTGRPTWTLLADSKSEGFRNWKRDALAFGAAFPQASHGEATPSDRDPIPPPFENAYNQPERDRYHVKVKYYRDDKFFVENMIDDDVRERLDEAWADLKASFDYHDAILDFVETKFDVASLKDKQISDLSSEDVDRLPEQARVYVRPLWDDFHAVRAELREAMPGHLDDALDFASRAWRRPLSEDEQETLRKFYRDLRDSMELDHAAAVRALLTRVLVSPAFLYRLEEPAEVSGLAPLTGWELANRLSYFLWASVPDEELRRAAESGELTREDGIERQVRRMLQDPKARRFATEFFGQWLGFYRFDEYRGVDIGRFPEFSEAVKDSMYGEAISFFEHVMRNDRPVRDLYFADYTFLNEPLAKHYGIEHEAVKGDEMALIEDAGRFNRGGLLRMGAVLTATSAPLRTSPVKRGDWILRRVLGTPVPPPPPDAGSIPADDKLFGEVTVKQRLESHRTKATCASCHVRIDPLGFSLEHFDSIGRWRDTYTNGQAIEDSDKLTDGTEVAGVEGLLSYLEKDRDQVLRNLSFKLLGYALGRMVLASDLPLVSELVATQGETSFAEWASRIVASRQFRYRRGIDETPPALETATVPGGEATKPKRTAGEDEE